MNSNKISNFFVRKKDVKYIFKRSYLFSYNQLSVFSVLSLDVSFCSALLPSLLPSTSDEAAASAEALCSFWLAAWSSVFVSSSTVLFCVRLKRFVYLLIFIITIFSWCHFFTSSSIPPLRVSRKTN